MSQNSVVTSDRPESTLSMIAAVADNGVIGKENALPWHLPDDLKHFKALTVGKTVIMGRKTYDSIGRALPRRRNIVITTNPGWHADDVDAVTSLSDARRISANDGETMIIGGAAIYALALPFADRIYLTQIHADVAGDTGFPKLDMSEWWETERKTVTASEAGEFSYSFVTLTRR